MDFGIVVLGFVGVVLVFAFIHVVSKMASEREAAAQTFGERAGNCLSLVIMTAAFARLMGLPFQFQSVYVDDAVNRRDDFLFFIGHVNLTLAPRQSILKHRDVPNLMTVDFLPPQETQGLRIRVLSEQTIVAMYMNNRAAEALGAPRSELPKPSTVSAKPFVMPADAEGDLPVRVMSAVYRPAPVTFSLPSCRICRVPMTVAT